MKHAIITGGSSGIGKATAALLLQRGWSVSIIARDEQRLSQAITELKKSYTNTQQVVKAYQADVTDIEQINQAVDMAIDEQGMPDLLITSAGASQPGYFAQLPIEDFAYFMQLNYLGTVYAIKAVLPYMLERKQGQIMMISSMAGLAGVFGYASYSPTKAAVKALASVLRCEMKCHHIVISICYPPSTDTPMLAREHRPLETQMLSKIAGLLSVEEVAHCIVKGIEKKSFAVIPGWNNKLFYFLNNFFLYPWFYFVDRVVARARKIRFAKGAE